MCNLIQRPSGYYFRLTIPIDLRKTVGIREIKRSLRTGSLCLAKERAFLISGRLKKLFRIIRRQEMKLTKDKIANIINQYIEEGLNNIEEYLLPKHPISDESLERNIEGTEDLRSMLVEDMMLFNYKAVNKTADEMLVKQDIQADKDSHEYRQLCHDMLKARVGLQDVEIARVKGDYGFKFPYASLGLTPTKIQTKNTKATIPDSPMIKDLVQDWFKENTKADLWKPRTLKQYTGHLTVILQVIGENTPILSIDFATVKKKKNILIKLPPGMNKKKIFQNKSIREITEITEAEGIDTLNVNTINSYIITLGAFFKWCVGNGHMLSNYAEGIKIKVSKQKRPDEIREAFSPDHMAKIFNSPEYLKDSFEKSYQFWLPILGLFTGARLNELCQLRLGDIQKVDGILSLVLQEDSNDKTISIKNAASLRTIPLHPFISNDLNFGGYIASLKKNGETKLFPELPYQNFSYGHSASKWFQAFKSKCGIDSSKLVFHSFRHTLSDNLKQQLIAETLIDELTGHAIQGETMGRYGKRYGVKILYDEAVLKLNYGVDLKHLKDSKWLKR